MEHIVVDCGCMVLPPSYKMLSFIKQLVVSANALKLDLHPVGTALSLCTKVSCSLKAKERVGCHFHRAPESTLGRSWGDLRVWTLKWKITFFKHFLSSIESLKLWFLHPWNLNKDVCVTLTKRWLNPRLWSSSNPKQVASDPKPNQTWTNILLIHVRWDNLSTCHSGAQQWAALSELSHWVFRDVLSANKSWILSSSTIFGYDPNVSAGVSGRQTNHKEGQN